MRGPSFPCSGKHFGDLALGRQLFTADVVLTKGCPTCVVAIDTGMLGFPVA